LSNQEWRQSRMQNRQRSGFRWCCGRRGTQSPRTSRCCASSWPGGLRVTADLYSAGDKRKPTILLFHQSGSSRGECRQIARELVGHGFNALAVDMRRGGKDPWNQVENETAARCTSEKSATDCSRYYTIKTDIVAALSWLSEQGYGGPKLIWGSSISSIMV